MTFTKIYTGNKKVNLTILVFVFLLMRLGVSFGQTIPLHDSPYIIPLQSQSAIPVFYDAAFDHLGNTWVVSNNGLYQTNGVELLHVDVNEAISNKYIWGVDRFHNQLILSGFNGDVTLLAPELDKEVISRVQLPEGIETIEQKPNVIDDWVWFPVNGGGILFNQYFDQFRIYKSPVFSGNPIVYCGKWEGKYVFFDVYNVIMYFPDKEGVKVIEVWGRDAKMSRLQYGVLSEGIVVQKGKKTCDTYLIEIIGDTIRKSQLTEFSGIEASKNVRIIPSNDNWVWLDYDGKLLAVHSKDSVEAFSVDATEIKRVAMGANQSRILICGRNGVYILPGQFLQFKPEITSRTYETHGTIWGHDSAFWAKAHDTLYIIDRELNEIERFQISYIPTGVLFDGSKYHVLGTHYEVFPKPAHTLVYDKPIEMGVIEQIKATHIEFKYHAPKKIITADNGVYYFNRHGIGFIAYLGNQCRISTISTPRPIDLVWVNKKLVLGVHHNFIALYDFRKSPPKKITVLNMSGEAISNMHTDADGSISGNYKKGYFVLKNKTLYFFNGVQRGGDVSDWYSNVYHSGGQFFYMNGSKPVRFSQTFIYHSAVLDFPVSISGNLYIRNRSGVIVKVPVQEPKITGVKLSKIYTKMPVVLDDGRFYFKADEGPVQLKISDDNFGVLGRNRYRIVMNNGASYFYDNHLVNISYLPPRESIIKIYASDNDVEGLELKCYRNPKWHESYLTYFSIIVFISVLLLIYSYQSQKRTKIRYSLMDRVKELDNVAFKARFNPHFLFNALNSLQLLIENEDYRRASLYIKRLSDLFRNFLKSANRRFHTMTEEIDLMKSYIELQLLKYNNSFTVKYDLPQNENLSNWTIPTGLLQLILENAIKHGMSMAGDNKGILCIRVIRLGKNEACVEIIDNGPSFDDVADVPDSQKKGTGTGMSLVKERIEVLKDAHGYNCYILPPEKIQFSGYLCMKYALVFNPDPKWLKS